MLLVLPHPKTIANHVGRVNDEPYQIVTDEHPSMTPMPFDFLRLVTGGTKNNQRFAKLPLPAILQARRCHH